MMIDIDRKIVYIYTMWFNPVDSKNYGDLDLHFSKEARIAVCETNDGKYHPIGCSDDYYIYDDGSNHPIVEINETDECICIDEVSFDSNYMEEFKIIAIRLALHRLWEYVRKVKEQNENEIHKN